MAIDIRQSGYSERWVVQKQKGPLVRTLLSEPTGCLELYVHSVFFYADGGGWTFPRILLRQNATGRKERRLQHHGGSRDIQKQGLQIIRSSLRRARESKSKR